VLPNKQLISEPFDDLPGALEDGSLRTAFHGLAAGTFRSTLIVVPTGQTSPRRDSEIEHIILILEGAFTFQIDDDEYRLKTMDQIFVPVGVCWVYKNAAPQQSTFLSIVGP